MPAPPETLDLLRGCPGLGTYWFRPDEANTGYFRLSFGRTALLGSGSHTNAVRAAVRNPHCQRIRLLVEVEPGTARVDGMGPAEMKRWWAPLPVTCWTGYDEISPGVYRVEGGGPILGLWSTDSTPEVVIKPLLPKNLRAVGVKRMTLGPEDARRESWVWVVEFVEKGKRAGRSPTEGVK